MINAKRGHSTDKLSIIGIFDRASKQIYVEVMLVKLSMNHLFRITNERLLSQDIDYC